MLLPNKTENKQKGIENCILQGGHSKHAGKQK
jgi:hypothetical protein